MRLVNTELREETSRHWLAPALGVAGTLALGVVGNLLAPVFPELYRSHPIIPRASPWIAVGIAIVGALHYYARARRGAKWEGIEVTTGLQGYVRTLEGSEHHPQACMPHIGTHLDFMGHGASKWTKERELLENMLQRTYARAGQIRFLVLDPSSEVCLEASRVFHGDGVNYSKRITESLMVFRELEARYRHLKVRLYCHRPQFRLTIIDREGVTVGHYMAYRRRSDETPLHVYTRKAEWTFFAAFTAYFEDEWQKAAEVDWNKIEAQALHQQPFQGQKTSQSFDTGGNESL